MKENKKTVFIVDDEPTNLTIAAYALSDHYNVFTFNSGANLMKRLEKQIPDVILLDVEMPDMNGYETIKKLKENDKTKDIPVIFVTARSDTDSEFMGLSLGAIDYIIKPFLPPLLHKRIEIHLLIESQKNELRDFNNNLQKMVDTKTKSVVELQHAILSTMTRLVDRRDDITGAHIERTMRYMDVLLNKMKENKKFGDEVLKWKVDDIIQSTQLHDVGKIGIKDDILNKPGKLTDEEFDMIKKHTIIGEEIINDIQKETSEHDFLEYAKIFVGYHHEKWNGCGYHRGLSGEDIPLLGRAMAIVDVYDALVSDRPYKKGFSHEKTVAIITEERGNHFDPDIVDVFLSVEDEFKEIAMLQGE